MTAKRPLSSSTSTPKFAWSFGVLLSPQTLDYIACRELDDALGLTDSSAEYLKEGRTGKNILHKLIPLLRQSIYSRLAGYDDTMMPIDFPKTQP